MPVNKKVKKNKSEYAVKFREYNEKVKKYTALNKKLDVNQKLDNELKIDKYNTKLKNLISKKIFNDKDKLIELENDLEKIGNTTLLPTKAYSKSYNLFRIVINKDNKFQPLTRDEILNKGKRISKLMSQKYGLEGSIESSLNFDGIIRSSTLSSIGSDVKLFRPEDFYDINENDEYKNFDNINKFDSANLYIYSKNHKAKFGGYDNKFNDCLWYCINQTIPQYNPWKQAYKLKNFLGLKRRKLVSIDDMEKIERKIGKCGINITGDCEYTSKINQIQNIFLILKDNHYSINHKINKKVSYVSFTEKKILIHDKLNKTGYNGKEYINLTDELYDDVVNLRTEYILVPKKKDVPIEEFYLEYTKIADGLKTESNGVINLYKTGSIKRTALHLLDKTTKHIPTETILYDEALIIENATTNGFIFNEEYEGKAYKGDIVSMYPSIYASNNSLIPISRGEFKTLTNNDIVEMNTKLKGGYAYGFYKYKIYRSGNPLIDRLFRFNDKLLYNDDEDFSINFYTSIDLIMGDILGLKKELIETNNNALLYPRKNCLTGHQVFNQFKDIVYPLKDKSKSKLVVAGSKSIMNIMSGSIGQVNKRKLYVDDDGDNFYDLDEMNLRVLRQSRSVNDKATILKCVDKDYYYNSQLARFKPFMLAQARMKMLKLILPVNDKVKKVYIDSIISTEPLEYKDEFGELKFEYEKNIKIVSNRKEIFI